MVVSETAQSPIQIPPVKIFHDPYFKVRIDSTDHDTLQYYELNNWTKSTTTYNYNHDDRMLTGLVSFSAAATVDISKSITFPKSGWYRIEVGYRKNPTYTGGFTLHDGASQVGDLVSSYSKYDYMTYYTYPLRYYTKGSHTIKLTITRPAVVRDIVIVPITRWEGDNQGTTTSHTKRLDISEISFTQNSVAELNVCSIDLPLKETYLRDSEWYTPYVFDYNDHVTVWMGETRRTTKPVFGGYLTTMEYDGGELRLSIRDRLLDLDRVPLYHNFSIGGVAAPEGSTRPFTSFPSVYELARYLAESCRYPLKTYTVPYEFAVQIDFSSLTQYNNVSVNVWNKYYDLKHGHPAPGLKLSVGELTGTGSATIYNANGDPYDAATYEMLSLDYYASGSGSRYPLKWNVIINMHRKDETINEAKDYTIQVNNGSGDNQIATHTPILNGQWQRLTLDIKAALAKVAASTNYYINTIRLEGEVSETQETYRRCSTLWVGGLYAYKSLNFAPRYASQDVKTPLEELRQLCERTGHAAYVTYNDNREDDVLVVSPMEYSVASVAVIEGDNLIELEGVDYDPIEDGYANYYHMTFNNDAGVYGASRAYHIESAAHYREYQRHDFNSSVDSQVDADGEVNSYIGFHKWPRLGFTVRIKGTTDLVPEQYASVTIPSHHIGGNYPVKTLTHSWSLGDGYYTEVDFGKPSNKFRQTIQLTSRAMKSLAMRSTSLSYRSGVNNALGGASPGAFVG